MRGGELGRQRLDPEPLRQVRVTRRRAEDQVAGPEPARVDVHEAVAVVELEAHARVRRLDSGVEQERPGHPQVHEQVPIAR